MFIFSLIPPDSEVPPRKLSDIGETISGHNTHAEHAMSPSIGNFSLIYFSSGFIL